MIVHVLHRQRPGRHIEHFAHAPLLVVVELALGELARCGARLGFDVQIDALLEVDLVVAFGGALERVDGDGAAGGGGGFRFREHGGLFFFAPDAETAKRGFDLCEALLVRGGAARANGDEVDAVVVFAQTVFEAVVPITGLAVDANGGESVDGGFAGWIGAFLVCELRCLLATNSGSSGSVGFPSCGGPFAGMGAFVRGFGAVDAAEAAFTGFAAEGEEVVLVAPLIITVGPDGVDIFVWVHFGVALWFGGGSFERRGGG